MDWQMMVAIGANFRIFVYEENHVMTNKFTMISISSFSQLFRVVNTHAPVQLGDGHISLTVTDVGGGSHTSMRAYRNESAPMLNRRTIKLNNEFL